MLWKQQEWQKMKSMNWQNHLVYFTPSSRIDLLGIAEQGGRIGIIKKK
jgi:hypothetical protein